MIINIAKDFSVAPGPRFIYQGDKSGELFRTEILEKAYLEAKKNNEKITVILDGTFGYFDSFLEESFGGLKRDHEEDDVLSLFEIVSNEEPALIDKVKDFVANALNKKK